MTFLTHEQCREWCLKRNLRLKENGSIRPDFPEDYYHIVQISYPADSGKKVHLAKELYSIVNRGSETLLLIDDWSVWPSSGHLPLLTRLREALGESRLPEAPGHLVSSVDSDDAISIIIVALLFIWDCYGISQNGSEFFYFSHDEYCCCGTRDKELTEKLKIQLGES